MFLPIGYLVYSLVGVITLILNWQEVIRLVIVQIKVFPLKVQYALKV